MYTTFEADIKDGRIMHADVPGLPASAHVLITVIGPTSLPRRHKPDWGVIESQIGKVTLRQESMALANPGAP